MDLLNPNVGLAIWTIVTFVVVLLVLRKFAWKPILESMRAREEGIQRLLDDAEGARDEAQALLEQYRRQLAEARAEGQRLLAESKAASERVRTEMLERARGEAETIVARAGTEIDQERQKALAEIRERAVDLAISAAGKVIEESLDDERNRRLVESYLREVESDPERLREASGRR
ncbi:MAG: F0F1 ATP synthase subunit B [Gemmatimonadota bacterium]